MLQDNAGIEGMPFHQHMCEIEYPLNLISFGNADVHSHNPRWMCPAATCHPEHLVIVAIIIHLGWSRFWCLHRRPGWAG